MSDHGVLREITAADAAAVLDLITLCDIAESGEVLHTIDEVQSNLVAVTQRGVGVDDPRGGLAAYAWVDHRPTLRMAVCGIYVRPGGDWSVAPMLLGWVRETASTFGGGLSIDGYASAKKPALCALYESAGATVVRRYYRMEIPLGDELALPVALPGVVIRGVATEDDLRAMHAVVDTAFEDHFAHEPQTFETWRQGTADGACSDLGLWWLAVVDGRPAAGLYGFEMPATGYIDTLGTLREFRGRGLGAMLLRRAFAEFHRRDLPKAALTVDATNPTGALGLYLSVGMAVGHEDLRYSLPA